MTDSRAAWAVAAWAWAVAAEVITLARVVEWVAEVEWEVAVAWVVAVAWAVAVAWVVVDRRDTTTTTTMAKAVACRCVCSHTLFVGLKRPTFFPLRIAIVLCIYNVFSIACTAAG